MSGNDVTVFNNANEIKLYVHFVVLFEILRVPLIREKGDIEN